MTDQSNPFDPRPSEPYTLFTEWFTLASQSEPNDPSAAALATANPDGQPSVRMVLTKPTGGHPFCFFTNSLSPKGRQLAANPRAALCFHWKTLRRQVRVDGSVTELAAQQADDYFHSRARISQVNSAVSLQSQPLASRLELEEAVQQFAANHPAEIPRPIHWLGYHLHPAQIEFWIEGPGRLHHRLLFTRQAETWQSTLLYP